MLITVLVNYVLRLEREINKKKLSDQILHYEL